MARFKHGDIFTVQLPNQQYLFGRILLDLKKQCVKPKLLEPGSPLTFFGGSLLVETYRQLSDTPDFGESEVLLKGVFVDARSLKRGHWTIIDHHEVDPTQVEFPEGLVATGSGANFQRGEISMPVALSGQDVSRIHVYPTQQSSLALADICLYYLGLKHLIEHEYRDNKHLRYSDLRFSDHRSEIYQLLGEDESQTYYQMSTQLGYDIARFYG